MKKGKKKPRANYPKYEEMTDKQLENRGTRRKTAKNIAYKSKFK